MSFHEIYGQVGVALLAEKDKKTNDMRQGLLGIGLWFRLTIRTLDLG